MPLTRSEVDDFLASPRLAHLATVGRDGLPWVRPVWYVWDNRAFFLTTRLVARKTGRDLLTGAPAAVSIANEEFPYRGVVGRGTVDVWDRDRDGWLERIARRYDAYPEWFEGALAEEDRAVLRLLPTEFATWDFGRGDYEALNAGQSLRTQR